MRHGFATGSRQCPCRSRFRHSRRAAWAVVVVLCAACVAGTSRLDAQSSGSGYLARVGPSALRIAVPLPPAPVAVAPNAVPAPATNEVAVAKGGSKPANPGAGAADGEGPLPSPEEFLGPPMPLVIEQPLPPRVMGKDIYPPVAPVESSTVVLGGVTNPPVITAQMLVRFFRQPALQAPPAGGTTPTPPSPGAPLPPSPLGSGPETSLYIPVQFTPPAPPTPLSSTATYTQTPKEPQGR